MHWREGERGTTADCRCSWRATVQPAYRAGRGPELCDLAGIVPRARRARFDPCALDSAHPRTRPRKLQEELEVGDVAARVDAIPELAALHRALSVGPANHVTALGNDPGR